MSSETITDNTKDENIAIRVSNLSKGYEIYERPQDRLWQSIFPRLQRLVGLTPKKYFSQHWALNDISFEVKKGETLGIIGRNGAGKSTLLQIITGTLSPTSGAVDINGRVAALLELGSGFNPEFTGRENVYMNAAILGLTTPEIDAKYEKIIEFADVGKFIEQPVKTYSSGMLVRLAFAVIAHVDADVLIIDEALSVGDVFFTQKCIRFIRAFQEKGTVLFVSHDTGAVLNMCDKAVYLDSGRIESYGNCKSVVDEYLGQGRGEKKINDNIDDFELDEQPMGYLESAPEIAFVGNLMLARPSNRVITDKAEIISANLLDIHGYELERLVGGQEIILEIKCQVYCEVINPIIGFQFRDRLGQVLFGENTFKTYENDYKVASENITVKTIFRFELPYLNNGVYFFSAAIATGTQNNHEILDWKDDIIKFEVVSGPGSDGLIHLPMNEITICSLD